MAVDVNRVIEKPERRPMLATVQKIQFQIALARNERAKDWDFPRSRNGFRLSLIRKQVKGRSKERDFWGLQKSFLCVIRPFGQSPMIGHR